MDVNALRLWGVWTSAALIAGALAAALWSGEPRDARAAQGLAQAAQAGSANAAPAPVAFLVRFRGDGPIARAQTRARRGDEAGAGRQVEVQLQRQSAFRGLCFDRFTVGAAEIVLRSCAPVAASARAGFQAGWLARLKAMRAVEYADANAIATPTRAP